MEHAIGYDELTNEHEFERVVRGLRIPLGRKRDASIVGIYKDALRHKDGAMTVAYQVETPATMFADDELVDVRYDDLARMLASEKPPGTLVQFRYSTIPDQGRAISALINVRSTAGTHTLAGLLQASNLDCARDAAKTLPYRRSVLTMWVRVPPKKRGNSTLSSLSDFRSALANEAKSKSFVSAVRNLPRIYLQTADDAVVRQTLEAEQHSYLYANRIWRQIENSSPLMLRRFTRQENLGGGLVRSLPKCAFSSSPARNTWKRPARLLVWGDYRGQLELPDARRVSRRDSLDVHSAK